METVKWDKKTRCIQYIKTAECEKFKKKRRQKLAIWKSIYLRINILIRASLKFSNGMQPRNCFYFHIRSDFSLNWRCESNVVINGNQIRGDRLNRYSISEIALDLCRLNWFLDFQYALTYIGTLFKLRSNSPEEKLFKSITHIRVIF